MSLETNLVFLIIFGFIGYATEKTWGFNIEKVYSDIGGVFLGLALFFLVLPVVFNPNNAPTVIDKLMTVFTDALPGAVIGDIAGSFVSKVTGGRK